MSKLGQLGLSCAVMLPLLMLTGASSEHSKNQIRDNLDFCKELQVNNRGYVKGIVTEVIRDKWNAKNFYSTISNNQCDFSILHRNHRMLKRPGTRVKALVEVESENSGNLLFNKVTEDLTVVDTNGNVPEIKTVQYTVPKDITDKMRGKKNFTIHTSKASYNFPEHVISKVKPIKQTWYYQEGQFSNPVVVDVE
jgi:hypothetical protein